MGRKKKLFLVDGSNHAFRVQFALPPRHSSDGFPTRVLYGFTLLFQKMMRTYRPDYCVVSFDSGKSFRHEQFPDYKGHRPSMPDDLARQWGDLPALVEAFGYKCIQAEGYEADDVLGTLARQFSSDEVQAYIVSSDKDFAQLVGPNISTLDEPKDKLYDPEAVHAKYGVRPDQMIDALGLSGDSSDNIPGVPGIGLKTAAKLLDTHGDLEAILAAAADGKIKGKRGQNLVEHAENARLSKQLVTIETAVDLGELALEDLAPIGIQNEPLRDMFDRWEFGKVARKLLPKQVAVDVSVYRTLRTDDELDAVVAAIRDACTGEPPSTDAQQSLFAPQGGTVAVPLAIDLETTSDDRFGGAIVGAGLCWGAAEAAYVPLFEREGLDLDADRARAALKDLLEDPAVQLLTEDSKSLVHTCRTHGIDVAGVVGDIRLLDYVLVAHRRTHSLGPLAEQHLGHNLSYRKASEELTLDDMARFGCETAHVAWLVNRKLTPRVPAGPGKVYRTIELPLVPVLADMERVGIRLDQERLAVIREDIQGRVVEAEKRCHDLAGREFKVGSTKEVATVLFDERGLPPGKKTKTGFSTDSKILEKLTEETDDELPAAILEWRSLSKLDSTYLSKLPNFVGDDGRIHTSFNQAVAATGRLSSTDPNLQNIPIRTFEGRRIRDAFVADPGHVFLSVDYSQVELRVLAHFCGSDTLVASFKNGEDIHRRTASEVFGIPMDEVTNEQRSSAKAVNFGLIYGMSAFRLGRDLLISRDEATAYMEKYFDRLPKVNVWLEETRAACKRDGYVETLYGRRRLIPEIYSKNFSERSMGEREAVNTCIQGTAADIIKIAMMKVDAALRDSGSKARLLLQVHDELLLEVPEDEIDAVTALVVTEMEAASPEISVPIKVHSNTGRTWSEAHD